MTGEVLELLDTLQGFLKLQSLCSFINWNVGAFPQAPWVTSVHKMPERISHPFGTLCFSSSLGWSGRKQNQTNCETPTHSKHYPWQVRLDTFHWRKQLLCSTESNLFESQSSWSRYIHGGGGSLWTSLRCQLHKPNPKCLTSQFIMTRAYECLFHFKLDTTRRYMDGGKVKLLGHQSFELNKFELCNVLMCY